MLAYIPAPWILWVMYHFWLHPILLYMLYESIGSAHNVEAFGVLRLAVECRLYINRFRLLSRLAA